MGPPPTAALARGHFDGGRIVPAQQAAGRGLINIAGRTWTEGSVLARLRSKPHGASSLRLYDPGSAIRGDGAAAGSSASDPAVFAASVDLVLAALHSGSMASKASLPSGNDVSELHTKYRSRLHDAENRSATSDRTVLATVRSNAPPF
jgi:hypothetical protein